MSAEDSPVRALHNAVALSVNPAEASTRPAWTTAGELRRMVSDVVVKLEVDDTTSVIEIGCGTGVLAVPVAHRSGRFVGVDFSEQALAVLASRFDLEGIASRTDLVCLDLLRASSRELSSLGTFDRVLVYATLHYVANEEELDRFLDRALALLAPGGLALFGNLPLEELRSGGNGPLARSLTWTVSALAYRVVRRLARLVRRAAPFQSPELKVGTTLGLSASMLDSWLAGHSNVAGCRWVAPGVGTPLFSRRADLVVRRQVL